MTTRNATEIKTSENQSKFIQDRIGQVEKYFGEICDHFGAYARKCAKLRDKGDEVCKSVMDYAINSTLNGTSKTGLTQFAEYLSAVQDYRNAQVQRLEAKVIAPLSTYGNACKHAREDLKAAFAARGKEEKQQKQYDKIREKNPSDRQQISQAETELQKAHVDASRTSRALEEQMDEFEKKKLGDIKHVLTEFVQIEMLFHAKSLELLTQCFHSLETVNEEEDLEEFRNSLRPHSAAGGRHDLQRANSKSSLNSTNNSVNKATPSSQHKQPQPLSRTKHERNMYSMHDEDDEDEEDDDEDEEDDEEEYSEEESEKR